MVVSSQAADVARVAVPTRTADENIVALRKPLDDVRAAARDVRLAFTDAALVGLGVALLLGAGIAGTLLRRLRRLRRAALDVAEHGLGAGVPEDRSPDEVGDLSRAFARMQSRLRHEEESRRNFVATASHEMRTPLASLQGMLELLEQDLEAMPARPPDAREAQALPGADGQAERTGRGSARPHPARRRRGAAQRAGRAARGLPGGDRRVRGSRGPGSAGPPAR